MQRFGPGLAALSLVWGLGTTQASQPSPATPQTSEPTTASDRRDAPPPGDPRSIGLTEETRSTLAQIDVTVEGPPDRVRALSAEHFSLQVNRRKVEQFSLDRVCNPVEPAAAEADSKQRPSEPAVSPPPLGVTYLLFIDQTHLSLSGRAETFRTLRELVPRLLVNGSRAMLVSNAGRMQTIQTMTGDPQPLLDSIDRLELDRTHFDLSTERENSHISDLLDLLRDQTLSVSLAIGRARRYQREEALRAAKSFRRLALSLSMLSDTPSPKAVILFSDSLRSNAGEHYLSFFGTSLLDQERPTVGVLGAQLSFDKVVNEAAAQGIRFYPVKADGLAFNLNAAPSSFAQTRSGARPDIARRRHYDSQDTLGSLAAETGGEAFVYTNDAERIADGIFRDLSCLFVLSFDPARFKTDAPLSVKVKLRGNNEGVRLHTRGRIVFQSKQTRETSRLLSAFAAPELTESGFGVRGQIIPTGFADGKYSGLLQITVPANRLLAASWDLGASIYTDNDVAEELSGRVSLSRPGVPLVFEREVRFKPGEYEIVYVARETRSGLIEADRLAIDLPKPRRGSANIGPISLFQPRQGLFVRGDESRSSGAVAQSPAQVLAVEAPTALVGLVCAPRSGDDLVVERWIEGADGLEFPPMSLQLGDERCAQFRDVVPAGGLPAGDYRYQVRLMRGDKELTREDRTFRTGVSPG